jgi:hypothetical protein
MRRPKIRNLIQNDGLTQPGRFLEELDPQFVDIDDRTIIDFLAFVWRHSAHLNFFEVVQAEQGEDVQSKGNWQHLLRYSPIFFLSLISGRSPVTYSKMFEKTLEKLEPDQDSHSQWQEKIYPAFMAAVSLCEEVEAWSSGLPVESTAYLDLKVYIGQLALRVEKLLALYNQVDGDRLWEHVSASLKNWELDRDGAEAYGPDLLSNQEIIDALREIFSETQTIYASIVNHAKQTIDVSLGDATHQAHVGLLLAFLRLLERNRNHLNLLTGRHLDFYLQEILRLEYKTRIADTVNLTFELAKNVSRHRLEAGTAFKGGKNEEKVERLYDLKHEATLSRAAVADLKNLFVDRPSPTGSIRTVHAGMMANSLDGQGKVLPEDNPKWPAFGNSTYPFAELGFVVSSPLFRLSEGERKVALIFGIADLKPLENTFADAFGRADNDTVSLPDFLTAHVSTAKGWYDSRPKVSVDLKSSSLKVTLAFDMDTPAIVDYDAGDLEDPVPLPARWPVFRLTVDQQSNPLAYDVLRRLRVKQVHLVLEVDKVRGLVLANDAATLKADKPLMPFGSQPKIGSTFFVGHAESFAKPLTRVDLTWNWIDPPQDIESHYHNYTRKEFQFTAQVELRENYRWGTVLDKQAALSIVADPSTRAKVDALDPKTLQAVKEAVEAAPVRDLKEGPAKGEAFPLPAQMMLSEQQKQLLEKRIDLHERNRALNLGKGKSPPSFFPEEKEVGDDEAVIDPGAEEVAAAAQQFENNFSFTISGYDATYDAAPYSQFSESFRQGGLRFRLKSPDFTFGHKSYPMLHSQAVAAALHPDTPDPEPLNTLQPPYTPMFENIELSYRAEKTFSLPAADANLELILLQPFGYTIPQTPILAADYPAEGSLYIGLADLAPPQNLSLLIQLAEGSGDPFILPPQAVTWAYLTDSGWHDFTQAQILRDGTLGFLQSGIIEFSLPEEISAGNPGLPQGLHWLRVLASDHTTAVHDVLDITAQAGVAVYRDEGHSAQHLTTALPAGSISKLLVGDPAIKTIAQPFASYGGRESESDNEFRTRSSERVRHKDRAIGLWDYERLVLEHFPEVHKVKCLNHTCLTSPFSPGNVTLVLIPDMRNRNNRYPLRPAVPQSLLEEVKQFVLEKCSAHVDLHVVNPLYERISVDGLVHFHKGLDPGFYQKQLHDDITQGLTPWLRGEEDIHFGGRIHSSVILNLIEELDDYVDYLSEFSVTHYVGPDDEVGRRVDEVIATGGRSILVSDDSHTIQGISPS